MRFIRSDNRKATPIKWSYKDASNRIKPALESSDTALLEPANPSKKL
jgi:hypothetical protein